MATRICSMLRAVKSIIARLIFQFRNKDQKLLRYFQRKDEIRMEYVEDFLDRRFPSSNLPSPLEMVAVLSLIAVNESFPNVIRTLTFMSEDGIGKSFDDEFFFAIDQSSRDLDNLGMDKEAGDLLKIGEIAAQIHNETKWEHHFNKILDKRIRSRISDLPFLHQRGW